MAPTDPHQGGDLFDMAAEGTSIPNDAGKQRLIPSVPRPDQMTEDTTNTKAGLGAPDEASAADNATDMPRGTKDMGATGEVITGTGDQMPAQMESKRMHYGANNPLAKGHDRYDKHARQNESDLERYAKEGAEVDAPPGEEGLGQDEIRDSKGL
ncbi:MAG: hypothetical protein M1827_006588 [Pycnora praestabilis]|nr:MAG: hypothetical protein M1827_006588 [Pycnora praestabilis]